MITYQIKTQNTIKALKQVHRLIEQAVIASGTDIAMKIKDTANALVPQAGPAETMSGKYKGTRYARTGKLQQSIEVANGGNGVQLGNSMFFYIYAYTGYEHWVEFGKNAPSYATFKDTSKHEWSTYPGAVGGVGFMRAAINITAIDTPRIISGHIINRLSL